MLHADVQKGQNFLGRLWRAPSARAFGAGLRPPSAITYATSGNRATPNTNRNPNPNPNPNPNQEGGDGGDGDSAGERGGNVTRRGAGHSV
jgi:hypothetical protein